MIEDTPPALTLLARIDVDVAAPIDLGVTDDRHRRIIPSSVGRCPVRR